MSEALRRRLERMHERERIRSWELRQLEHSSGVWYRLQRALTMARSVHLVAPGQVAELLAEGWPRVAVGLELTPSKEMVWASGRRIAQLEGRRTISTRDRRELLAAPALVLEPFDPEAPEVRPRRDRVGA